MGNPHLSVQKEKVETRAKKQEEHDRHEKGVISIGWVRKYQTRTDQSNYADNWFVDYDKDGTGKPGDFYDIGDDGIVSLYVKNGSVKNLAVQSHYRARQSWSHLPLLEKLLTP